MVMKTITPIKNNSDFKPVPNIGPDSYKIIYQIRMENRSKFTRRIYVDSWFLPKPRNIKSYTITILSDFNFHGKSMSFISI